MFERYILYRLFCLSYTLIVCTITFVDRQIVILKFLLKKQSNKSHKKIILWIVNESWSFPETIRLNNVRDYARLSSFIWIVAKVASTITIDLLFQG